MTAASAKADATMRHPSTMSIAELKAELMEMNDPSFMLDGRCELESAIEAARRRLQESSPPSGEPSAALGASAPRQTLLEEGGSDDAPLTPHQIGARYERQGSKNEEGEKLEETGDEEAPLPPDLVHGEDGIKSAGAEYQGRNVPRPSSDGNQLPTISDNQSRSRISQHQRTAVRTTTIRPPTPPRPNETGDDVVNAQPRPPPTLEATLVQGAEATLIEPVHAIAIQVEDDESSDGSVQLLLPWWKKYQRFIWGTLGLLVAGLAIAVVAITLRPNENAAASSVSSTSPTFSPLEVSEVPIWWCTSAVINNNTTSTLR